jgi:hypothetical protein
VPTKVILPKGGVSVANKGRVLINVHGGGFYAGAGAESLIESIPVAALGKLKVITIDYRQGPEYKFPAASEDTASVYKGLLKDYKPHNIGIYGCSAGGILTAMAVAWLENEKLPLPGAIGIFGAGAFGGWYADPDSPGSWAETVDAQPHRWSARSRFQSTRPEHRRAPSTFQPTSATPI